MLARQFAIIQNSNCRLAPIRYYSRNYQLIECIYLLSTNSEGLDGCPKMLSFFVTREEVFFGQLRFQINGKPFHFDSRRNLVSYFAIE